MNTDAKVTSKGQVTLPARLRKELGIRPGDRIGFRKNEAGRYELVAKNLRFEDLRGLVRLEGPPRTVDQIVGDIEEARKLRAEAIVDSIMKGGGS